MFAAISLHLKRSIASRSREAIQEKVSKKTKSKREGKRKAQTVGLCIHAKAAATTHFRLDQIKSRPASCLQLSYRYGFHGTGHLLQNAEGTLVYRHEYDMNNQMILLPRSYAPSRPIMAILFWPAYLSDMRSKIADLSPWTCPLPLSNEHFSVFVLGLL